MPRPGSVQGAGSQSHSRGLELVIGISNVTQPKTQQQHAAQQQLLLQKALANQAAARAMHDAMHRRVQIPQALPQLALLQALLFHFAY